VNQRLTTTRDGLNGLSLGVHGGSEWARAGGDIFRRPEGHAGTYGGWRWECSVDHASRYPTLFPAAVLA